MTLIDQVVRFLNDEELSYQLRGDSVVEIGFRGEATNYLVLLRVAEDGRRILSTAHCGVYVPENKRSAVAEFLTRANWKMARGNFEMDFEDGEVVFRYSLDLADVEPSSAMLTGLLRLTAHSMHRYFAPMMGVIFGASSPAQAIAELDGELLSEVLHVVRAAMPC